MNGSMNRLVVAATLFAASGIAGSVVEATTDPYAALPSTLQLTGVVRDVKERSVSGGHPDFELNPSAGFGHYVNLVQDALDSSGKPVFRSQGNKVSGEWRDSAGRNRIQNKEYLASKSGDVNGSASGSTGGAMTNADRFGQWFRDTPGVNLSRQLTLTLNRNANSNIYTFSDTTDPAYQGRQGFFPINGELYGNSGGGGVANTNYHFTFELETQFQYKRNTGQLFTFTGDDDVWVFVDGKLVIDIGGIHSAVSQSIDLDRCNWLQDGNTYTLKFFFAERHRTQSNFRIDTTLQLRSVDPPTTTALYD